MPEQKHKPISRMTLNLISIAGFLSLLVFSSAVFSTYQYSRSSAQVVPQRNADWNVSLNNAIDKANSADEIINIAKLFPQVTVDYALINEISVGIIKVTDTGERIARFRSSELKVKTAKAATEPSGAVVPSLNIDVPPKGLVMCAVGPDGDCILFFNDKGKLDGMTSSFDLLTPTCDSNVSKALCDKLKTTVKAVFDTVKDQYKDFPQPSTNRSVGSTNFVSFNFDYLNRTTKPGEAPTLGSATYVERVGKNGTLSQRCIISIDQNQAKSFNDYQFFNTVLHEFGHCIGVAHPTTDKPANIMNASDSPLDRTARIGFSSGVTEAFRKMKQGQDLQIDPSKCGLYCDDNEQSSYSKQGNVNKYVCVCKTGFKKNTEGKCVPDGSVTGGGGPNPTIPGGGGGPQTGGGSGWTCVQTGDSASCSKNGQTVACTNMGQNYWSCGDAGIQQIFPMANRTLDTTGASRVLSVNKVISSSSVQTKSVPAGANFNVKNINDGKATTRWASDFLDNQWVTIDLGTSYTLDKVVLNWEAAFATSYKIQISDNNSSWTDAVTITSNTSGGIKTHALTNKKARYVRLFNQTRTSFNGVKYGFSLWEVEVWGR